MVSISFDQFEIVDVFLSRWNQFHRDNLDLEDELGSKKLIKRQFKSDLSQNLALG